MKQVGESLCHKALKIMDRETKEGKCMESVAVVTEIEPKTGQNGSYRRVSFDSGARYNVFDNTCGLVVGRAYNLMTEQNGKYTNLKSAREIDPSVAPTVPAGPPAAPPSAAPQVPTEPVNRADPLSHLDNIEAQEIRKAAALVVGRLIAGRVITFAPRDTTYKQAVQAELDRQCNFLVTGCYV